MKQKVLLNQTDIQDYQRINRIQKPEKIFCIPVTPLLPGKNQDCNHYRCIEKEVEH